jgi:hypothetical protein
MGKAASYKKRNLPTNLMSIHKGLVPFQGGEKWKNKGSKSKSTGIPL